MPKYYLCISAKSCCVHLAAGSLKQTFSDTWLSWVSEQLKSGMVDQNYLALWSQLANIDSAHSVSLNKKRTILLFVFSAFNCPANLASHRRWHKPRPATHPATNHQGVKSMKPSPLSTGCVEKENQSISKQIGVLSPAFKIDIWFLHQLVACNYVVDIF